MIKNYIILVISLLIFNLGIAQDNLSDDKSKITLLQTDYVKTSKQGQYLGVYKDKLYFCNIDKNNLTMSVYNTDLKIYKKYQEKLPDRYKKLKVSSIVRFEDEFCINTYFFNKELEKTIFFKEVLSIENLKIIHEFKKVKIIEGKYTKEVVIDSVKIGNTSIHVIKDNNYIDWTIVITENNNQKLTQNNRTVFNTKNLNKHHVYEDVTITNNKDYLIVTTRVYNSYDEAKKRIGSNYTVYNENVKTKIKINNYKCFITIINLKATNANDLIVKSLEIKPIDNAFIKSCSVEEVGLDSFLLTGVYAIGMNVNTKGVYSTIFTIADNNEIIISNYYEFSEDFIMKYKGENEKEYMKLANSKGVPYDFFDYKNIKTFKLSDGGFVSIIEKRDEYNTRISYYVAGTYTSYPVFNRYNSDLYVSYISPNGKVTEVLKIPKKQVTISLEYGTFKRTTLVRYIDNNIVILCNDYQKLNGSAARRLITFVVDESKSVKQDIKYTYDYIDKADLTLSDTWIDNYRMVSIAEKMAGKRKIVITDFEYLLK